MLPHHKPPSNSCTCIDKIDNIKSTIKEMDIQQIFHHLQGDTKSPNITVHHFRKSLNSLIKGINENTKLDTLNSLQIIITKSEKNRFITYEQLANYLLMYKASDKYEPISSSAISRFSLIMQEEIDCITEVASHISGIVTHCTDYYKIIYTIVKNSNGTNDMYFNKEQLMQYLNAQNITNINIDHLWNKLDANHDLKVNLSDINSAFKILQTGINEKFYTPAKKDQHGYTNNISGKKPNYCKITPIRINNLRGDIDLDAADEKLISYSISDAYKQIIGEQAYQYAISHIATSASIQEFEALIDEYIESHIIPQIRQQFITQKKEALEEIQGIVNAQGLVQAFNKLKNQLCISLASFPNVSKWYQVSSLNYDQFSSIFNNSRVNMRSNEKCDYDRLLPLLEQVITHVISMVNEMNIANQDYKKIINDALECSQYCLKYTI